MSCRLGIKVTAKASRNCLQGWMGDVLKITVTTAPEKGKANDTVIRLLAGKLDIPASSIEITSGHTQPRKVLEITGLTAPELQERLAAVLK